MTYSDFKKELKTLMRKYNLSNGCKIAAIQIQPTISQATGQQSFDNPEIAITLV